MNLDDIQSLIKFVAKSGATEVDLEFEGIKISIKSPPKKKRGEKEDVIIQNPPQIQEIPSPPISTNTTVKLEDNDIEKRSKEENENENYITIKSSMIGTFYRSSSPENDPFVSVGDIIKQGDPICIIEAMKLFNEIESEISGTIVKVLVDDATPVEFDQDLFLVDPS